MWFTETPWPPVLILSMAGAVFLGLWLSNRSPRMLAGLIAVIGLSIGTYFLEQAIVTDSERVEAQVHGMVDACRRGDVEATVGYISPREIPLQLKVAGAMALADVEDDVRVTDMNVRLVSNGTEAISHFRANATINVHGTHRGRHPSRWEVVWQRQPNGTDWKVIEIRRLNIIDGREMEMTGRSE